MANRSAIRMPLVCRASAAVVVLCLALAQHALASPQFKLVWESGFEQGFPGEWLSYDSGSRSTDGTMPQTRVSAWTIVSKASGEPIFSGNYAYRGWIVGPANASHRAYPVIHANDPHNIPDSITTPLVNSFMVWLDSDWASMGPTEWIQLATWSNNTDWLVHTMVVKDRKLCFAHTDPFTGEYIGPLPRPDFPLHRWVRMTAYIAYNGPTGFVQVWQDGIPMLRARVVKGTGTALVRAHWGLYAHPAVSSAVMYNDDIRIWTLSAPPTDFLVEPLPNQSP